ncbi:ketosteroid isomerase-like protein [Actinocorallia herbida]|uniref:Ketosteroid isomerase-like protein n=1 Tax=Actinocorallia herbida TaxID=58109 RepID=A0A3N1CYD0_9ACTN|nr:nuclear transport factor 2 family protein [Actinocorallia herbida]ROO86292.1 ketosteroid isomerase-like protein [Actinocorallia herbida]
MTMEPVDVLERYYQAMLDKSADALADLYAEDAVHEFPFAVPFPPRLEGREAVRGLYRAAWGESPVRVREIRRTGLHPGVDPEVVVSEQVAVVVLPSGEVAEVPGLLVLRVRDGLLVHVRDYMDMSGLTPAR